MTGNFFLLDSKITIAWLKGGTDIADKIDKAKQISIQVLFWANYVMEL